MILNKYRIIFFLLIFYLFSISYHSNAYKNFDECGLLEKKIKEYYVEKSLDEPGVFINEYAGINFEYQSDSEEFKRDKNNYLIIDRFATDFEDFEVYEFPLYLTKIQNYDVKEISNDKVNKIFEDKNNKVIDIEFLESNSKKLIVKRLDNIEYDDNAHRIKFKPTAIDKIDSAESTYIVSYIYSVIWENIYYDEIAKEINKEMLKKFPENKEDLEKYGWFCLYDEEKFKSLNIFEPEISITNLVQQSKDELKINYEFNYVDEHKTLYVTKTIQGVGKFKAKFNYSSFPFDKQKMVFFFSNDDPFYAYNEVAELTSDGQEYLKENFLKLNYFLNQWKVKSYNTKYDYINESSYKKNIFSISYEIERLYFYYIAKILLPILLILMISWSVFWLNPKYLEGRLTVGVVCLLSLIAYNFVVDKDIPKLGYLTIMDYIILVSYFFSSISTLQSIFINATGNNLVKARKIDNYFKIFIPLSYVVSIFIVVTIGLNY